MKNENYLKDLHDAKCSLPNADSFNREEYVHISENGNKFTFKKFIDEKPHGWQQVVNKDFPDRKND